MFMVLSDRFLQKCTCSACLFEFESKMKTASCMMSHMLAAVKCQTQETQWMLSMNLLPSHVEQLSDLCRHASGDPLGLVYNTDHLAGVRFSWLGDLLRHNCNKHTETCLWYYLIVFCKSVLAALVCSSLTRK